MKSVVLGLDPGGIGKFGWCVAEAMTKGRIRIRKSGVSDNAANALKSVREHVSNAAEIRAAGIDSPLFWVHSGDRRADQAIRHAMTKKGAKKEYSTVQQVNSLRGACLAQGILAAHLLRRDFGTARLTESHPKALLWLLGVATKQRPVAGVTMERLIDFIKCDVRKLSEHERDAALGAVGAFAMLRATTGWRNLAGDEEDPFVPVGPVEYWMPIPIHTA